MNRLEKQLQFILEIDKVKKIIRQTPLADASRKAVEDMIEDISGALANR